MVPGFLVLPSMYFTPLARLQSYSILYILCICVAAGTLHASYKELARMVRYSMLMASDWFFDTFLPEYTDQSPVIISVSLTLGVMCVN